MGKNGRNYFRNTLLALARLDKPFIIRGRYFANPHLDYLTYTDIRPYVPAGASTNMICDHVNVMLPDLSKYIAVRPVMTSKVIDMSKEFIQAQERTNPVFMTAKTAICLMAKAELPGAEAIVSALGLENSEPLREMSDEETILGNALVVEAKYRTMCRLIEDTGFKTCVDLPCGYTPKAIQMTGCGLRFVGLDLPIVVEEVAPVMRSLGEHAGRMSFCGVDATNYASLEKGLQEAEGPLCITTEGMMMYFTEDEVENVIANIGKLLTKYGGCWITPDPEFLLQFVLTFRSVFGENSLGKLRSTRNAAKAQSDVASLSNSFILKPADIPGSLEKAETLLTRHRMKAEKINLGEVMPDLNIYKRLTPAQVQRFKEGMQSCHYWFITLDSTKQEREEDDLAGQKQFEMQYSVESGIMQLCLVGRLDSISSPELLMAWEAEQTANTIDGIRIDCSGLEYISSAGIRLLQELQAECPQGIGFNKVCPAVKVILKQNGFTI